MAGIKQPDYCTLEYFKDCCLSRHSVEEGEIGKICADCQYRDGSVGHKEDSGKPRMELLPFDALVEVSKVLTHGAKKYAADNWQKVPYARSRYTGALMRHLAAWKSGETIDPDSGADKLRHIAQVACNALFLVWFELHRES
jgi:hypothetical protein